MDLLYVFLLHDHLYMNLTLCIFSCLVFYVVKIHWYTPVYFPVSETASWYSDYTEKKLQQSSIAAPKGTGEVRVDPGDMMPHTHTHKQTHKACEEEAQSWQVYNRWGRERKQVVKAAERSERDEGGRGHRGNDSRQKKKSVRRKTGFFSWDLWEIHSLKKKKKKCCHPCRVETRQSV